MNESRAVVTDELELEPVDSHCEMHTDETVPVSSKQFHDNEVGMDSWRAWALCFACFIIQMLVIGNVFCFGVFLPQYIDAFSANKANASIVGSLSTFFMLLFGTVVGALDDRFDNYKVIYVGAVLIAVAFILASFSTQLWQLYLTHGFIGGVGYSFAYISTITIVAQWFKKWRGFAVGFAIAGGGLGQFVMAQVVGAFISASGWRWALRYLAIIDFVVILLCGSIVRRRLPCSTHFVNLQLDVELFKNRDFMLLTWGYTIFLWGLLIPNTYLLLYSEDQEGISNTSAVLLFSMFGLSNLFGRVIIGGIGDVPGWRVPLIRSCAAFGSAITFCWIAFTNFSSILAYALLQGFVGGGIIGLVPSIAADIIGVKKISSFLGILYSLSAFSSIASPPIGGALTDAYNSYTPAIIMSGAAQAIAMLLLLLMNGKSSPAGQGAVEEARQPSQEPSASTGSARREYDPVEAKDVEMQQV